MKVMKFGGTSVGSPERMKEVVNLILKDKKEVFVVLSAMSGTTNTLIEIADYLYKKNHEGANEIINRLEQKYISYIDELYSTNEYKEKIYNFFQKEFNYLRSFYKRYFYFFRRKEYCCARRNFIYQYGSKLSAGEWYKGEIN